VTIAKLTLTTAFLLLVRTAVVVLTASTVILVIVLELASVVMTVQLTLTIATHLMTVQMVLLVLMVWALIRVIVLLDTLATYVKSISTNAKIMLVSTGQIVWMVLAATHATVPILVLRESFVPPILMIVY
jgi:hypothetical protein